MIRVNLPDPADAADLVDALLIACQVTQTEDPRRAERYRQLAHAFGDGLDQMPPPSERTRPCPS